jgi:transcriptional regulator with XRE-family HTH domain
MISMATLHELREQAGLSLAELARRANVDYKTAKKADDNKGTIQRIKALALLRVISRELERELKIEDVDGLQVH